MVLQALHRNGSKSIRQEETEKEAKKLLDEEEDRRKTRRRKKVNPTGIVTFSTLFARRSCYTLVHVSSAMIVTGGVQCSGC